MTKALTPSEGCTGPGKSVPAGLLGNVVKTTIVLGIIDGYTAPKNHSSQISSQTPCWA